MKGTTRFGLILLSVLSACREGDGTLSPGGGRVYVDSDPPGANILVDNRRTGRQTPDTLRNVAGRHDISAQLDTFRALYGFTARVFVPESDSVPTIAGPLVNRCSDVLCYGNQVQHFAANRIRFASNPVGTFFLDRGAGGNGIVWPVGPNNSYASGSMIAFAGILNGRDTVALGIYDNAYLAGRPAPLLDEENDEVHITQTTWIVPPANAIGRPTVRGIQVTQEIFATPLAEDIVMVRLVFRNITNEPLYRSLDPTVPAIGLAYDQVFIGFMLDPDIGVPGDDAFSYEPILSLAFAYDSNFDENGYGGGYNKKPGLIGLRMVVAPEFTRTVVNGWTTQGNSSDWFAGQVTEPTGWYNLSGVRPFQPDHPDIRIGHLDDEPGDVRLSVSAGPLHLNPGDTAAVTIAVMLADPVPGAFTSGTRMDPGDPNDRTRVLYSVAGGLLERAGSAGAAAVMMRAASRVFR
jgi:PEGA domain